MGTISYQSHGGQKHLINQCQINEHDQLSCLHGHKHAIDQCQTNRHNQLSMSTQTQELNRSMPDQWAQPAISVFTDKHAIDQCQTNGHDLQLIRLEQGHDYSKCSLYIN